MSAIVPELESATAEEILAYGVDRFHPRMTLACSFQKEESVLLHMLSRVDAGGEPLRAFVIDTGVLFPETLRTWKLFEERFPEIRIDVIDARSSGAPWTQANCCSAAKVAGLERALAAVDAWVTGLRREQSPTRTHTPKVALDDPRSIFKLSPLADWTEKDVWTYVFAHELPYNPLHDQGYDSIGCAPCTMPGEGRDGRWVGEDKTECGIHVV
jgi:phosphoadenosine phosphosulfate reductase